MKNVTKILKQFCSKLVAFSEDANELMEMTEGLKSVSSEGGMKNFSTKSRVRLRQFSEKANKVTTALEDFSVWSDDMLRACPKENERLGRKLRMTYKCFSELEEDFKKVQEDVKDAIEIAASEGPMSKSAPSNPAEPDLQKEDTTIDAKKSTVNGAMPEGTTGDSNITASVSVNKDFSKEEYLKSLFDRISTQIDNFSDKLNDAGDMIEEVTDEVVESESVPEDKCPDCGEVECKCSSEDEDKEVDLEGTVLENKDIDEDVKDEDKTDLVKTEDEVSDDSEVAEFCSYNFSQAVASDKDIDKEVHDNLKALTAAAEAIKSGSAEELEKAIDKVDELQDKNKNFAAITACALMCFSEICKECGQVIPGTEDKVETSAEDVKVTEDDDKVVTEDEKVEEALDKSDEESDNSEELEPPTDEEIIMNFSQEYESYMDKEFQVAPCKHEGETEAKPEASEAPSKKEGQENMTDIAPIHPDAVKIAMFSVLDKCDEFLEKKVDFSEVVKSANFAESVIRKSYDTPELGEEYATKFANFCGELGLYKATEAEDSSNAVKAAPTTVDPVVEGDNKLNKVVETLKSKLEDLDLDPTMKSFATKLCDEFSSTKCFSEDDLNTKLSKISSFSDDLKKISGTDVDSDITLGDDTTDVKVEDQVESAVAKKDSAEEIRTEELKSEMTSVTEAPNTPSDEVVMTNFSKTEVQSTGYGSRMLSILGIR